METLKRTLKERRSELQRKRFDLIEEIQSKRITNLAHYLYKELYEIEGRIYEITNTINLI